MTQTAGRGFTLVEMLLTLALMGIVLLLALPRFDFSLLQKFDARTTADRMVGDLRLTRQMAVAKATSQFLVIGPNHTYKLYSGSVSPENELPPTRTLPSAAVVGGDTTFQFLPTGALDPTSGHVLTLQIGSSTWTITITPATGFVSASESG